MAEIYEQCVLDVGASASVEELVRCAMTQRSLSTTTTRTDEDVRQFATTVLLVIASAMVVFMQAGFAMICAGCVQRKNVQNTLLKNLLDACGVALAYFSVGYAFSYGDMDDIHTHTRFIGASRFFLQDEDNLAFFLFQYAFAASTTTIIAGTLMERSQMISYFMYSMFLAGFVYPVVAHAIWNPRGFLSSHAENPLFGVGMVDFAGGAVVHFTGGLVSLLATTVLGPRRGRFHDEDGRKLETPRDFPGQSVSLQMLGTLILWFGWYGFNAGSALPLQVVFKGRICALAAVNSTLSAGAGCVSALFFNLWLLERTTGEAFFDVKFAMNGTLAGLVAITGPCGVVEPWAAVVIGLVAGLVYIGGTNLLVKLRLDDAVDAIPVHLGGGFWGILSIGFFGSPRRLFDLNGRNEHVGWFYSWGKGSSDATLLGAQVVGLLFQFGWIFCTMYPFFRLLDYQGWFRSDPLEEIVGLDTSYHGGILLAQKDDIDPEYMSAFRKRRTERAEKRRSWLDSSKHNRDASSVMSDPAVGLPITSDPESDQDADTPAEAS